MTQPDLTPDLDGLRARVKELEALLGELMPSTKPCVCRKGVVAPKVCAWCRARAVLAQKEPEGA